MSNDDGIIDVIKPTIFILVKKVLISMGALFFKTYLIVTISRIYGDDNQLAHFSTNSPSNHKYLNTMITLLITFKLCIFKFGKFEYLYI